MFTALPFPARGADTRPVTLHPRPASSARRRRNALFGACLLAGACAGPASAQYYGILNDFGSGVVTAGDQTGAAVAILGDVNGDGTDDMLIGAPFDDDNGADSGTVYVVNGYYQSILYELHGSAPGNQFGAAVANIGDMNNDGIDDFVVGSPGVDFNGTDTGGITVYSGSNGLSQYSQLGPKPNSRFGATVAGGGDLNNDGRGDFIVGAPSWDSAGSTEERGWAGVYSGQAGNQIKTYTGAGNTHMLGGAVAFVGDLNGDGRVDYAIGTPGYDYISQCGQLIFNGGRVEVYSGLNHALLYTKLGGSNDVLGTSIARAGDTDGDGIGEVIAGAPGDASNVGAAYLYEGSAGTLLHTFTGNNYTPSDYFGAAVGPMGDVNHDGLDDVVVGAPLYDFTVGLGGYIVTFLGGSHAPYAGVLASPIGGDALGSVLSASAGDLSGDDWNDVLAGWPFNDFAGTSCGTAKAYILGYQQPNLNFQGPGFASLGMFGTPLYPGGVADISLFFGKPNSPAWLVASPVEIIAPFKGGVLVPSLTPGILLPFMTDAQGRVKLSNVPGGGGPLIVFVQFLIQDASQPQGWQISNAIAAEFLP